MGNIKAVGFDYGGVIAGKTGVAFGKEVAKLLDVSFDRYKEVYFAHNKKVNVDGMAWPEFWKLFANEIGQPEKYDDIMQISNAYGAALDVVNPEIVQLIDLLRVEGFRLGLLSNNSKEKGDMIRAKGLESRFDVFHISEETGLMKPQPEAFRQLAKELGVELGEMAFIDDSEKSLSTAAECGFTSILFEDYEKLLNDLQQLGILERQKPN